MENSNMFYFILSKVIRLKVKYDLKFIAKMCHGMKLKLVEKICIIFGL